MQINKIIANFIMYTNINQDNEQRQNRGESNY